MSSDLGVLTALEWQGGPPRGGRSAAVGRWLLVGAVALVGWAAVGLVADGDSGLNLGGWPQFARFWSAAVRPDLSAEYVTQVASATLTTLAFAMAGTTLAVAAGLVLAPLLSETWWGRPTGATSMVGKAGRLSARLSLTVPRGIHEAVWALLLLSVMGRDPIVGILSIAIPFGAITAKVYADMIDNTDRAAFLALRQLGAGRVVAMAYGIVPHMTRPVTSYAFYRLECAIRSSAIIGMIGAGGLGFQLMLSFQGLAYEQMWTVLYALALLSCAADAWGSALRRRPDAVALRRLSIAGAIVSLCVGWLHLDPDLGRLMSADSRLLLLDTLRHMVPPALPDSGLPELVARAVQTLQMSLVGGAVAFAGAVAVSFVAARGPQARRSSPASSAARLFLLVCRAIPAPVWALLVLFLVLPGPLPGALALGIYNFGILGRLCAEVVENLDPAPRDALGRLGAPRISCFAYATLPAAMPQFVSYGVYRWEVAARETIVLGVVAAGGLGVLLQQQRAAFDYAGMTGTILAMVVVSAVVDLGGAVLRRSLRR